MNRELLPAHPAHEFRLMSNFALIKRMRVSAHSAHRSFGSLGRQSLYSQGVRVSAHPPIKRAPSFKGLRSLFSVTTSEQGGDDLLEDRGRLPDEPIPGEADEEEVEEEMSRRQAQQGPTGFVKGPNRSNW